MIGAQVNLAQEPAKLADLIEQTYMNPANSIVGRNVLLLRNAVDDLRAAVCTHQNISLDAVAADAFSGRCRDCGADVRSGA